MKKIKYVFSRKITKGNLTTIRESFVYLPESKEDKLKVIGPDYFLGETYKITHENGEIDIGFDFNDIGRYRIAHPGEKIRRVVKYDYSGKEITKKK